MVAIARALAALACALCGPPPGAAAARAHVAAARRAPPAPVAGGRRLAARMAEDVSSAPAALRAASAAPAETAYDRALAAASPAALSTRPWDRLWCSLAEDASFVSAFGRTAWKHEGRLPFAAGAFTMADLHARAREYPSVFGAAAVKYNEQYLMRSFNPAVKASGRPGAWSLDLPDGDDARIDPAAVDDALLGSTVVLNSAGFFIAPLSAIALSMLRAFGLPVWLNSKRGSPGVGGRGAGGGGQARAAWLSSARGTLEAGEEKLTCPRCALPLPLFAPRLCAVYLTRPGLALSTQLHTDLQACTHQPQHKHAAPRRTARPALSAALPSRPLSLPPCPPPPTTKHITQHQKPNTKLIKPNKTKTSSAGRVCGADAGP